ncbi:hypothetical protein [Deinococcus maricopensis]|uniref:Uncharacterized protein n=1 Tax=Deinococcus maricopensis (strain DSM 21211 / LMG 22137 / NRRL B-23946 / LB-34) TaxID=709986 RepID=E8U4Z9_DEIML|nr:hypothetical protein [Deinococcus maricopensis]ADV66138.1 hypothetical protein Deima_0478 [Deinococcus maricopensis DSM 21211]
MTNAAAWTDIDVNTVYALIEHERTRAGALQAPGPDDAPPSPDALVSDALREHLEREQRTPDARTPLSVWSAFRAATLRELCERGGVIHDLMHQDTVASVQALTRGVMALLAANAAAQATGAASAVSAALAAVTPGPVVVAVLVLLILKIGLNMICQGYTPRGA